MTTATATKSKRGTKLTPELQEQLTAYFPYVKRIAFEARSKYKKSMPEISLDDWVSHLTEWAVWIAPCWQPEKGAFGTLLKIGLGNIVLNLVRDYSRGTSSKTRGKQCWAPMLDEVSTFDGDVADQIISDEETSEARGLLSEIRSDVKKATKRPERLALVRDFLKACDPGWLHKRPSKEIANLLGVTVGLIQRARGFGCDDSEPSPETAPAGPITADLPQVEVKEMPAFVPPANVPVTTSPPKLNRQRFGLRLRSRRWLVASFC